MARRRSTGITVRDVRPQITPRQARVFESRFDKDGWNAGGEEIVPSKIAEVVVVTHKRAIIEALVIFVVVAVVLVGVAFYAAKH